MPELGGERFGDDIERILLFGSVARAEERGVHSDVDLLVVLSDDVDDPAALENDVRELAYDVELAHSVVPSLVVRTESEYERARDRPFFRTVRRDSQALYG
ncbi:nucleotidyltransferase domain-containing protein [Halovivax sp.]|uniref:nucleotidyltransferase domain-containing protein n=1 Tax=Halovivax sp. TaxID=1935978 RepID=UPI0037436629